MPAGLIVLKSSHGPDQTAERLIAAVERRGVSVLADIDHARAAETAGLDLRPTRVIVFGNPKGGTPLMQDAQTSGIDLPLKALVWRDVEGVTWLGYNDPAWIAERHAIGSDLGQAVKQLSDALEAIARDACDGAD